MKILPSVPTNPQQFAAILSKINARLNTRKGIDDTLKRILLKEGLDKPNTPTPHVVTSMIKEFTNIPKEFQDKSPLICDTQPEI